MPQGSNGKEGLDSTRSSETDQSEICERMNTVGIKNLDDDIVSLDDIFI